MNPPFHDVHWKSHIGFTISSTQSGERAEGGETPRVADVEEAAQLGRDMPGRLMAQENVKPNKDTASLKSKLAPPLTVSNDIRQAPTRTMDVATQNGASSMSKDQKLPNGISTSHQQNEHEVEEPSSHVKRLPPEIEHITENFFPLSRLFDRASQECYNALGDLLTELEVIPDAPQPNGVSATNGNGLASATNARKRNRWLQFSHDQRQKFMQLLVILQWSQRADDVSKLIDLTVWTRKQAAHFNFAELSFGNVKRGASVARVAQPNIDAGLRVLRADRQSPLTHLDYIPTKPLPPQKVLETLRNLNIALQTRLNLYEHLPPYLKDYRIANGRVTFTIPHEFEVDLAIADEDSSSQFWFQDVRLLFASIPDLPTGQFSAAIEQRVNSALGTHGLAGCIEVLHEYALTLKISLLRQQFVQLSRGIWTGSLGVEQLNRSLVVQYWPNCPGKKSWIQIGVKRGQPAKFERWSGYWPSRLSIKWMRQGKEVHDLSLSEDLLNMSAEQILKSVTAHHVVSSLNVLKNGLGPSSKLIPSLSTPSLTKSDSEPADCALRLPPRLKVNSSVVMEPISGKFVLQPASAVSVRFERELNRDLGSQAQLARVIERWQATEIRSRIQDRAQNDGWIIEAPPGAYRDSFRKVFGADTVETMFMRKAYWGDTAWHVVISSHPGSECLWIARLVRDGKLMSVKEKEPLNSLLLNPMLDPSTWSSIHQLERVAVSTICSFTLRRKISTIDAHAIWTEPSQPALSASRSVTLDIKSVMRHQRADDEQLQILDDRKITLMDLGYLKNARGSPPLTFLAKGRLRSAVVKTGVLDGLKGKDFSFNRQGIFVLKLVSKLGSSSVTNDLSVRLSTVERLGVLLNILRQNRLKCDLLEFNGVTFQYAGPDSRATVVFDDGGNLRLDRVTPATSPHRRIAGVINRTLKSLQGNIDGGFRMLLSMLVFTLPLLNAFEALEIADSRASRVRMSTHDFKRFSLLYPLVGVTVVFDFVSRRGQPYWCATIKPSTPRDANRSTAQTFVSLFMELAKQMGEGWRGLRSGLVATPRGVGEMVSRVDKIAGEAAGPAPPSGDAVVNGIVPPRASQKQAPPAPQPTNNQRQVKGGNQKSAEVVVID